MIILMIIMIVGNHVLMLAQLVEITKSNFKKNVITSGDARITVETSKQVGVQSQHQLDIYKDIKFQILKMSIFIKIMLSIASWKTITLKWLKITTI